MKSKKCQNINIKNSQRTGSGYLVGVPQIAPRVEGLASHISSCRWGDLNPPEVKMKF